MFVIVLPRCPHDQADLHFLVGVVVSCCSLCLHVCTISIILKGASKSHVAQDQLPATQTNQMELSVAVEFAHKLKS